MLAKATEIVFFQPAEFGGRVKTIAGVGITAGNTFEPDKCVVLGTGKAAAPL